MLHFTLSLRISLLHLKQIRMMPLSLSRFSIDPQAGSSVNFDNDLKSFFVLQMYYSLDDHAASVP